MLGHSSHKFFKLDYLMPYSVLSRNVMSSLSFRVMSPYVVLFHVISFYFIYVVFVALYAIFMLKHIRNYFC